MVIPFAATPEWYGEWLRSDGGNEIRCSDPRSLRRTLIEGPMWLSVPVAKGPGMRLSDHGNWPHVHLGAINAKYGRYPYFPFLFDRLQPAYAHLPETLPEFNLRIHNLIMEWIDMNAIHMAREIMSLDTPRASVLRKVTEELKTNVNSSLSILDAIFRLGKNVSLLFV